MKNTSEIAKALYHGYCLEAFSMGGFVPIPVYEELDRVHQLRFEAAIKGMPDPKTMHDLYYQQTKGKTRDGKPLPTYDQLEEDGIACWAAGVAAAIAKQKEIA